ncbi:hypothetical protein GCM10009663_52490 [Kitasatospora arboriphila]|uniref:Uncharacterized protein n=1 Tax=Kitasatospora arboriphila TaxID=258052 RepID=A0ABP4EGJ9_9ACTN
MQATDTTFDGVGQLIGMSVFIVLAPPSSGADIPPHALPSFHRFLAHFEPMRQLSDGARATCASTTGRMPARPAPGSRWGSGRSAPWSSAVR